MGKKITTLEEAMARIGELEEEIKTLKASMPVGMSGWLITAPNKQYNGATLGVMFRAGQAFVPDGPGAERLVSEMQNDLGYQAQRIENWRDMGKSEADQVRRSMIDVLSTPQVM